MVDQRGHETADDYGTDPNILTDTIPPAGTLSVTNNKFATQHRVTLTGLQSNTTYYYRITAIHRSANQTVALPQRSRYRARRCETRPRPISLPAHGAGTYVSETADGEVILSPSIGSEFSGPALPAGWIAVPWSSTATPRSKRGACCDGARVATCQTDVNGACIPGETLEVTHSAVFTAPHSLEFSARFSGSSFQHAGLGVTFTSPDATEPWAIFSVMPTRPAASIFRAHQPQQRERRHDVLGNGLLGAFHRYRIIGASSVNYSSTARPWHNTR